MIYTVLGLGILCMVQEPSYVIRQPSHELFREHMEPKRESFKKLPTVWHPIEELKTLLMK